MSRHRDFRRAMRDEDYGLDDDYNDDDYDDDDYDDYDEEEQAVDTGDQVNPSDAETVQFVMESTGSIDRSRIAQMLESQSPEAVIEQLLQTPTLPPPQQKPTLSQLAALAKTSNSQQSAKTSLSALAALKKSPAKTLPKKQVTRPPPGFSGLSLKSISTQVSRQPVLDPTPSPFASSSTAKPSAFAQVLCQDDDDDDGDFEISSDLISQLSSMHVSSDGIFKLFDFSTPSPDSLIAAAREESEKMQQLPRQRPAKTTAPPKVSPAPPKKAKKTTKKTAPTKSKVEQVEDDFMGDDGTTPKEELDTPPKPTLQQSRKINVEQEYLKRTQESIARLNLVIIGHVDAGKSTLMGHLLYLLGEVDEKTMRRYERDSQKAGKGSFMYAWVLDSGQTERERGVTIDVAISQFKTLNRAFTILDAPGHRDFIPKMISGTAQADAAMLVIGASVGEFEAGFEAGGQTKEHAYLARSLGVSQIVVAVNKLDAVDWSRDRFDEIVVKLTTFLVQQAGFSSKKILFVPCSGLSGDNLNSALSQSHQLLTWYSGPTLVEALDKLSVPLRSITKPLRMTLLDAFKGGIRSGAGGNVSCSGRLDQGSIQVQEQVIVMPTKTLAIVKVIEQSDKIVQWAAAGEVVNLTLTNVDAVFVNVGCVICPPESLVEVSHKFLARIVLFEVRVPIIPGTSVIFHRQSTSEPAVIKKLLAIVNKSTGEIIKKDPRALPAQCTATVEIELTDKRGVCMETFEQSKQLGRFMLRQHGATVAAGIITKVFE